MVNDERLFYLSYAEALKHPSDIETAVTSIFHDDAIINSVHPFKKI